MTVRRWRFIECFMGQHREKKSEEFIKELQKYGFKAKVHAPLPEHKNSGHIHIVALTTLRQKCLLGGITPCEFCGLEKWKECYAAAKACDDLWKFLAWRGDLKSLKKKRN